MSTQNPSGFAVMMAKINKQAAEKKMSVEDYLKDFDPKTDARKNKDMEEVIIKAGPKKKTATAKKTNWLVISIVAAVLLITVILITKKHK